MSPLACGQGAFLVILATEKTFYPCYVTHTACGQRACDHGKVKT